MDKKDFIKRLQIIINKKFNGKNRRLSLAAKIPTSTLESYMNGTSVPGGEILLKLSRAAGVSIEYLLTGENYKPHQLCEPPAVYNTDPELEKIFDLLRKYPDDKKLVLELLDNKNQVRDSLKKFCK